MSKLPSLPESNENDPSSKWEEVHDKTEGRSSKHGGNTYHYHVHYGPNEPTEPPQVEIKVTDVKKNSSRKIFFNILWVLLLILFIITIAASGQADKSDKDGAPASPDVNDFSNFVKDIKTGDVAACSKPDVIESVKNIIQNLYKKGDVKTMSVADYNTNIVSKLKFENFGVEDIEPEKTLIKCQAKLSIENFGVMLNYDVRVPDINSGSFFVKLKSDRQMEIFLAATEFGTFSNSPQGRQVDDANSPRVSSDSADTAASAASNEERDATDAAALDAKNAAQM